MQITPQQLKHFDDEGYLFFPNCFGEDEIAVLRAEAEQIYRSDREEVWREKTGAPRTAFAAHTYNEAFRILGHHPRLVEPLQQYFGEGVYVHQFKINAKAAFEGDVWQWHQDYGTWARDDGMPEPRAMNIAVFLDEVYPINGALMIIPKSHKHGTLKAGHDKSTTSYPLWTLDQETVTRLCAEAATKDRPGIVAPDRLSHALRSFEPYHQIHAAGIYRASRLHADPACCRRRADGLRARPSRGGGINPRAARLSRRAPYPSVRLIGQRFRERRYVHALFDAKIRQ
jgi:ectoine hydroxylase